MAITVEPTSDVPAKAVKKSVSLPSSLLEKVLQCMAAGGIKDFSDFIQRACRRELIAQGFDISENEVDSIRKSIARAAGLGIDVSSVIEQAIAERELAAQPAGVVS